MPKARVVAELVDSGVTVEEGTAEDVELADLEADIVAEERRSPVLVSRNVELEELEAWENDAPCLNCRFSRPHSLKLCTHLTHRPPRNERKEKRMNYRNERESN